MSFNSRLAIATEGFRGGKVGGPTSISVILETLEIMPVLDVSIVNQILDVSLESYILDVALVVPIEVEIV